MRRHQRLRGWNNSQNAVIGITRGAILTLKRDELQGVIAHEFSHILNGDMRLNIRLMGLLHGILVLALIGYMVLRIVGNSPGRVSTRRSNDDNKGAGGLILAILAAGVALLIIGYVGVFFAHLIKSAVSRQREFLADASAVQFTRNPSGIADALKKIGGWSKSSKITSPRAEESSHMFFGSAMMMSFFATHPPLAQRILRIDPNFKGNFPESGVIQHDASEIIDPRSLSLQRSSFHAAHQAAVDGAESLRKRPNEVAESVGEPRPEHIEHVHGLVDGIDSVLAEDVRDPLGAVAVIYGLLLASPSSPHRETQLEILKNRQDTRPYQELQRILSSIDCLASEQRLPMVCLALPALHQMSAPQIQAFYMVVRELIQIDQNITIFEYAVHRYIAKRLLPRLRPESAPKAKSVAWSELQSDFLVVLGFLARLSESKRVEDAYVSGLTAMGLTDNHQTTVGAAPNTFKALDQSLDRLADASNQIKKKILLAFSTCVAEDKHVSVEEAELLRVIADSLGCPGPSRDRGIGILPVVLSVA